MNTCATCIHWQASTDKWDEIENPKDPDTYLPMETGFEVRRCTHPKLLFCERPLEPDGFAVADGSEYWAQLYTAQDFGCIKHEAKS